MKDEARNACTPAQIKKQIVEISKIMYDKGMVNAFEGNISVLFQDKVYITPSAICKGFLTEDMIVTIDLFGNVVEGEYKPSSEFKLHLAAYRIRPGINSVIHAHSPYATAFAVANKPIETKAYPEMIALFGKVPLADYGTPSTDEIYYGVEKHILDYDVILLANHGVMSVGKDAYEAFFKLESVECIAKVLLLTNLLGGEKSLPEDKLNILYAMREKGKVQK
ncbi:MAG TPA: class II aldolase/adducin family protein [Clostridiaceae bacterium]|nr:class II aldolase/adducin family protein [Clostridiaceae bacterium]